MNCYHFKVTAKFGHFGRNNYYEGVVYIRANTAKEAALYVRWLPRVKHHHKDAILSVEKIDYQQYWQGRAAMRSNPYFWCHSIQEQNAMCQNLYPLTKTEISSNEKYKNIEDGKIKRNLLRKVQRKQDKYKNNILDCV